MDKKTLSKITNLSIFLLVLVDILLLISNYAISLDLAQEAIHINLAGRQRMLSQRMSKFALMYEDKMLSSERRDLAKKEAETAWVVFNESLALLEFGGVSKNLTGQETKVNGVPSDFAHHIQNVKALLPKSPSVNVKFKEEVLVTNEEILQEMNALTFALSEHSQNKTATLRNIQTFALIFSMINFFIVLYCLNRNKNEIEKIAYHDTFSNILNRRGFYNEISKFFNKSVTLTMIDVDDFKHINDTHGHKKGDEILGLIGKTLESFAMKHNGSAARFGGDEFVLVIEESLNDSSLINELKKTLLIQHDLKISAGSCFVKSLSAQNLDHSLMMADNHMYEEKRSVKSNAYVKMRGQSRGQHDA